ncbi:MAG TPA: sigma 54-interacting transcriptional regulator [Gammaproteobacteria bacterium]|nr:sigma 54-interacting transcriptional regulator [Gammaproteobacteria bacterium]
MHRILVVDDDESLLHLLSLRLKSAGLEVDTAASGSEALARLPLFQPHVIITDLRMEGMDGMALFDAVHQQYPTLPVIILTAHGSIQEAVVATRRGVFTFLTKPFDSKELLAQVEKALEAAGEMDIGEGVGEPDQELRRDIITRSPLMEDLLRQARLVARSDASVFIQGESGTGKELLARAIHRISPRAAERFVAVNCTSIPSELLESELFGHKKGSFTGAVRDHLGLFKAADKGTLFLDEIGDMPLTFQAKLLRALQERVVRPVGGTDDEPVDVRLISATHQNLEQAMRERRFREDLYYRLNVVTLELPPLAARREDIPLLAAHFIKQLSERYGPRVKGFSPEAMECLMRYHWPGNIRQLYNVVEQTVALSTTPLIPVTLAERALREPPGELPSLVEMRQRAEREYITQLLQLTGGNVTKAARLAQRNRTEFYKLLNRYHLDPALFKASK